MDRDTVAATQQCFTDMVVKTLASCPPLRNINFSSYGSAENGQRILDTLYSSEIDNLKNMSFMFNKEWFEDESCCDLMIEIIMR